jgi:ABC-type transport system involved in multi-copper enzyme maturation permease subunit
MKALILKELRENLKLAALGLFIFALILVLFAINHLQMMKSLAAGAPPQSYTIMQPLASPGFWSMTGFFCAIYAAVLGWFQIHNERHRDLWAFLVHRPATRTEIFLGKTIAGLILYLLAFILPLTGYAIWALVPGNVAAPFEWIMLQPIAAQFLAGIVYYFAGMLTGLRQARWYGSRALGLGAALIVSMSLVSENRLWQSLSIILICSVLLVIAVWGGFHSEGFYRNQPATGRLALTGTLALGTLIIACFAAFLLVAALPRSTPPWSQHQMTKDGTIYRVTQQPGKPAEIVDLDGKPLMDAKTGRMIELADFNRRLANHAQVNPDFKNHVSPRRWYDQSYNRFNLWRATPDTFWYYWNRYDRLVGYDKVTRRFIGSLGPDGFSPDFPPIGARFDNERNERAVGRIINDGQTVYELDLEHRAVRALFTVTNESCEASLRATNVNAYPGTIGAVREVSFNGFDLDYTMVATRCFIYLLTAEGNVVWQVPYQPPYPDYKQAQVAFLEPTNRFALWMFPSWRAREKSGWKLPTRVTWLDRNGESLKSVDLPDLSQRPKRPRPEEKIIGLAIPPVLIVAAPLLSDLNWRSEIPWWMMPYSLAAALVCIPMGWWLGWRYQFSLRRQLGWAMFYLFWGIPGLLAFLCAEEWPAREICPACKKLRVVDREKCPHCGAAFAPSEKTGVEVFEPLAAAK